MADAVAPLPPRIPGPRAKTSRPQSTPAAAGGFRQKVADANPDAICRAATAGVGRLSMGALLALPRAYEVPPFQRRYCWTAVQWETLLADAHARRQTELDTHSLGRLTCTAGDGGRSRVLDGQQRLTTVMILLAALRDALARAAPESDSAVAMQEINAALFPDGEALAAWMRAGNKLVEGAALPFAKLIPSFCDRKAFYAATLPRALQCSPWDDASPPPVAPPLQARRYFDDKLTPLSRTELDRLRRAVWHGLTMLYFPVAIDHGAGDGTDDPMVVYERLALRGATWTRPTRAAEFVAMGGVDMVRNLLLGSCADSAAAADFHVARWLPLERLVEAAGQASGRGFDAVFEGLLRAFLAERGAASGNAGLVGGDLYASFEAWFQGELALSSAEDALVRTGQLLLEYAGDYLSENK